MEAEVPEVTARLLALYGRSELLRDGVVHVTSAHAGSDGSLHVIKIGEGAPRSSTDFFVLNLCRARADAIVTSAAILRSEPALRLSLQGPEAASLARYRRDVLGKTSPPVCALLTRSGDLPLEHPLWSDETEKLVLTSPAARDKLAAQLGSRAEVVGIEQLDARTAVSWLQARGLGLISMEAGPSTTGPLYQPPTVVHELLLSLYLGTLDNAQVGKSLPASLLANRVLHGESESMEESGRWKFQRWTL